MPIVPIVGPAGAGKSQVIAAERRPGDVLIDFTLLYAALSGAVRGPDGTYPEREAGDPLLPLVAAVKAFALQQAVDRELDGHVTSSARGEVESLERRTGRPARVVDPGEDTVISRLVDPDTGDLSEECGEAAARWYGDKKSDAGYWVSSSGRRYRIAR